MRYPSIAFLFALFLANPAIAQTIASSSSTTPYPGVRIVEGRTSGPSTNFHAAFISLCSANVHVDASEYSGYQTSGAWATSVGAELAVNGDFYTASPRNHVYGDVVAGGVPWALNRTGVHSDYSGDWYYQNYGWIAFGEDFVEFTNSEYVKRNFSTFQSLEGWQPQTIKPPVPPGTKALVSGFPQLVVDGDHITCSSPTASDCWPDRGDMRQRHPRTAMGLTEDRQTFILLVVDGRSTSSVGMYGTELAKLIHDLGAHVAFNLDGGGSTQMWLRGEGTVNRPSDGSPRSVMNHWGIFAGTDNGLPTLPGHCDNRWDGLVHEPAGLMGSTVDINGDGQGDTCARTASGLECSLFADGAFGPVFAGPALDDDSGWDDPSNYSTIRYGDIDGDGRADVCARANARMICWKSEGTGFGAGIDGPALSDEAGFFRARNYSTIRLADFNGDGMDDICARSADGMQCYPSTGDGFGDAIAGPALSDDSGWADPAHYGTIRVGDIDADGDDDICARGNAGMFCWRSDGAAYGERIDGPEWSNANGWDMYRYWSSIRLVDLDGDDRADLCGRNSTGVTCHLSRGDSFGPAMTGPALDDASGWDDYSNFASLRFADVTGDGRLDVCARANAGLRCWPFEGDGFGASFSGPMADATGWSAERFHRTIDFVDLDADGRADVCARASAGVVCWRSTGTAFEEMVIEGPAWSDESGFGESKFYGTVAFMGRVRPKPEEPVSPGGDTGVVAGDGDTGTGGLDGGPDADPGTTPIADGGSETPGADGGPRVTSNGGCGCSSTPTPRVPTTLLLLMFVFGAGRAGRNPSRRRRGGALAVLGVVLAGCSAPGPQIDPAEHDTYLVFDYDAETEEYRLNPGTIATLTDPHAIAGEVGFLRGGGEIVTVYPQATTAAEFEQSILIEHDREPSAEYTIEDGVVVPFDFDTQLMVTLYHHIERANEYFASLDFDTDRVGRLPIYYYPQQSVLGVTLPLFNDNAAYAFTLDAFLIPPRLILQNDVPLSANRGVIVHEYSHAVFNRIVHDDDRSPEFAFPGYSISVQNQIRSLDEGLADLFAALALGQPNFIESSISAEIFQIDRDLSRKRIWNSALQDDVDASETVAGLNPYILGSVVASTLWATRDLFGDEALGRHVLAAMSLVRNPGSSFHLADFFNGFLRVVAAEDRDAVCDVLLERLQLIEDKLNC